MHHLVSAAATPRSSLPTTPALLAPLHCPCPISANAERATPTDQAHSPAYRTPHPPGPSDASCDKRLRSSHSALAERQRKEEWKGEGGAHLAAQPCPIQPVPTPFPPRQQLPALPMPYRLERQAGHADGSSSFLGISDPPPQAPRIIDPFRGETMHHLIGATATRRSSPSSTRTLLAPLALQRGEAPPHYGASPPSAPATPPSRSASGENETGGGRGGRTSPHSLALLSPCQPPILPRQQLPHCPWPIKANADNHADGYQLIP